MLPPPTERVSRTTKGGEGKEGENPTAPVRKKAEVPYFEGALGKQETPKKRALSLARV